MLRRLYIVGLAFLGLAITVAARARPGPDPGHNGIPLPSGGALDGSAGADWFQAIKPFCNALEVETAITRLPPPQTLDGRGFAAACFAIAGKLDRARGYLLQVDERLRWRAAGIVFEVGHPIADAGDDRSAGPIMELVVEFWPNHYMALYHAGAAEHGLGQMDKAREHLNGFLQNYEVEDGWRQSALDLLDRMDRDR